MGAAVAEEVFAPAEAATPLWSHRPTAAETFELAEEATAAWIGAATALEVLDPADDATPDWSQLPTTVAVFAPAEAATALSGAVKVPTALGWDGGVNLQNGGRYTPYAIELA